MSAFRTPTGARAGGLVLDGLTARYLRRPDGSPNRTMESAGRLLATVWKRWRRPIHLGLTVVGSAVVLALLLNPDARGLDARGYWAFDEADPYREARGNLNATTAFRYAPPVALALQPLQLLPWELFIAAWTVLCLVALWILAGRWALAVIALYPVAIEVSAGNVNLLIGVAAVLGFRWPHVWAFVLFTKATAAIGLLWFAVRREWRRLFVALGTTAAISAVTWIVAPTWWTQWFSAITSMVGVQPLGLHLPVPLPVRFALAALLVTWGARTTRPWTVLVASVLALPTVWSASLAPLVGLIALDDRSRLRSFETPVRQAASDDRHGADEAPDRGLSTGV